jgi:hypothetical protein
MAAAARVGPRYETHWEGRRNATLRQTRMSIGYVNGAGIPRADRLREGFCFVSREDVTTQFHQQYSIDVIAGHATRLISCRWGKKIKNTVPVARPSTRLRTRIDPPCFCTMPRETHKPSPVPVSFFVV